MKENRCLKLGCICIALGCILLILSGWIKGTTVQDFIAGVLLGMSVSINLVGVFLLVKRIATRGSK